MKINFLSRRLLLGLNICCIFAAETPNSETSDEKVRRDMANQATVLKLLDDPNWRVQFPGIQQVKISQEMIYGSDLAGRLSEEFRKKNAPSSLLLCQKATKDTVKATADMAENKQSSSDEEICSLRIAFKW